MPGKQKSLNHSKERCSTCGTPLEEIPFVPCEEHKIYFESIPELTEEEILESMENELLAILYERTGDD